MLRSCAVSSRFAVVIQLCVVELIPAMLHDLTDVVRNVVRYQVLDVLVLHLLQVLKPDDVEVTLRDGEAVILVGEAFQRGYLEAFPASLARNIG